MTEQEKIGKALIESKYFYPGLTASQRADIVMKNLDQVLGKRREIHSRNGHSQNGN